MEFRPFLVCVRPLRGFRASGWHADYRKRSFDLDPGAVLAQDEPSAYWIDTEDEKPIGAIFEHSASTRQPDGTWTCDMQGDRLAIQMSERDHRRFEHVRRGYHKADAAHLINSIYLPALVHVLSEADRGADDYGRCRWFALLDTRLGEGGCPRIGQGKDRLADAQRLLDSPFGRIPLFAADEEPRT